MNGRHPLSGQLGLNIGHPTAALWHQVLLKQGEMHYCAELVDNYTRYIIGL